MASFMEISHRTVCVETKKFLQQYSVNAKVTVTLREDNFPPHVKNKFFSLPMKRTHSSFILFFSRSFSRQQITLTTTTTHEKRKISAPNFPLVEIVER